MSIYPTQTTIASIHTSPEQGIEKVWEQFRLEVRTSRTWHFVAITDKKQAADAYVKEFSKASCYTRPFTSAGLGLCSKFVMVFVKVY
jgi:hypothetical protein